jgi:hypothetical protein
MIQAARGHLLRARRTYSLRLAITFRSPQRACPSLSIARTAALVRIATGEIEDTPSKATKKPALAREDRVRLFTRRGFDWTARYPRISAAVAALRAASGRLFIELETARFPGACLARLQYPIDRRAADLKPLRNLGGAKTFLLEPGNLV